MLNSSCRTKNVFVKMPGLGFTGVCSTLQVKWKLSIKCACTLSFYFNSQSKLHANMSFANDRLLAVTLLLCLLGVGNAAHNATASQQEMYCKTEHCGVRNIGCHSSKVCMNIMRLCG